VGVAVDDVTPPPARTEYVQSLDRGFAVIRCFNEANRQLTIADIARQTGLTRATSRRFLLTLQDLGYVGSSSGRFFLRPRVLELGHAYRTSATFPEVAQVHLEPLADTLHESCSASVLDGIEIVYVARAQTNRIMTISLAVGSRLPAYATSMGRVLLANLERDKEDAVLEAMELQRLTDRTIVDRVQLVEILDEVRDSGFCIIDQELEAGVRSAAAPIHDGRGQTVAAINVSAHAARVSLDLLREEYVPKLVRTAQEIDRDLAVYQLGSG
jgi:IclR family pca regulon transcriptional regulator